MCDDNPPCYDQICGQGYSCCHWTRTLPYKVLFKNNMDIMSYIYREFLYTQFVVVCLSLSSLRNIVMSNDLYFTFFSHQIIILLIYDSRRIYSCAVAVPSSIPASKPKRAVVCKRRGEAKRRGRRSKESKLESDEVVDEDVDARVQQLGYANDDNDLLRIQNRLRRQALSLDLPVPKQNDSDHSGDEEYQPSDSESEESAADKNVESESYHDHSRSRNPKLKRTGTARGTSKGSQKPW